MIQYTRGIVIRSYKYSETSLIAHIFTSQLGMLSFLVPGARSKKAKIKASYFQHLTLVDMEIYYKPNRQLQKIKELGVNPVFQSIPYEIGKTSVAMFMAEVLNKTLQEADANEGFFDYLEKVIHLLDHWEGPLSNFPIGFLKGMMLQWGILPYNNYDESQRPHFNLQESCFSERQTEEPYNLAYPDSHYFSQVLNMDLATLKDTHIPPSSRNELLNKMIDYCRLHLAHFSRIQSIGILKEVLR